MEDFAEFMKAMYTASHPEHGAKIIKADTTTALAVLDGNCISPMACLDEFYWKYKNRELSLWEIWGSMEESLDGFCARRDKLATSVLDFNQIKNRICYKLVNREKNRGLLENSPHIPWLDLEIVFYIPVAVGGGNGLSLPVDNSLMGQWGITDVKEIYAAAHANTQKIFPGSIRDMEEAFDTFKGNKNPGEIKQAQIFMEEGLEADRRDPMYIATNSEMLGGACVILYDGLLKEFAGKLGNDLYIMASTVHESATRFAA